jgi:adenine-specific DNA-methyltransferase
VDRMTLSLTLGDTDRAEGAPSASSGAEEALRAFRSLTRKVIASQSGEARQAFARSFCLSMVKAYWRRTCVGALASSLSPCPLDIESLAHRYLPLAHAAADAASVLPKPLSAYMLSGLYTSMLPEETRSEYGAFYTPPPVVERLLDIAESSGFDWRTGSLIDPACGAGAFLSGAALRMAAALEREGEPPARTLKHVAQRISGVEIDPFAGWMAHVFLEVALWPYCLKARSRLQPRITSADALELSAESLGQHDLVVGNPPYGKVSLAPRQRDRFARSLYGHANLYGVFTDLAVQLARPSGIIAYVTPASFLGGQYFHKLRQLLGELAPPVSIDFITERSGVFEDVLQETVLAAFQRAPPSRNETVTVHLTQSTEPDLPCTTTNVGRFPLPKRSDEPWLLPREARHAALLKSALRSSYRLADYGMEISTGPLVWNRHKDQLAQEMGPGCHPLIWAEAVLADGTFRYSATRRNHQPYLRLKPNQSHLLAREGAVLVQRTTAKEQQRRLIAAWMPEEFVTRHKGVVIENHLNVIRASADSGLFSFTEARGKAKSPLPRITLRAIAALLNSEAVDNLFRCISGSVAVSAYELESLPVISRKDLHLLDEMIEDGASVAEREQFILESYGAAS